MMTQSDWELLAYDIADMLSDNEYPFDLTENDILPHVQAFIEQCVATSEEVSDAPAG